MTPTPPEAPGAADGRTEAPGTPSRSEAPGTPAKAEVPDGPTGKGTGQTTIAPTPTEVTEESADRGAGSDTRPGSRPGTRSGTRLLPHDECDKLELRLRNAVSGFVDGPRDAVQEADQVMEEIAGRFTEAVTRRRRALRTSWQDGGRSEPDQHPDTEQLRLALRDYRELAERLLRS
ncbi:hypothetical protein ACQEWB_14810 [Streptomyces sp. CA-249302]|uniref:hypothetical protein n=1 Tax=Streptomyces sp. CA-249302 TaxID=3240058 RepID=UPI003D8CC18A